MKHSQLRLMAVAVFLLFQTSASLLFQTSALADSQIEWEVKNPFRFFMRTVDYNLQLAAYRTAVQSVGKPEPLVSDVKSIANNPKWLSWWWTTGWRDF